MSAAMTRIHQAIVAGGVAAALSGMFGCPPQDGGVIQEGPPPPARELEEIVESIESNAALLDRALWSNSVEVTARLKDDKGREHVYNLDGNFLFDPPRNLRMDLRPGVGDQVMQIGSNEETYWLWIEPEMGTMWWAKYEHVGRDCGEAMSVRPDQLVAALGVGGLPKIGEGLIGPALRSGKTHDMLLYLREKPAGGYALNREYWVERRPPHMVKVVLFRDVLGRISMSAYLDGYRPAWDGGPLEAHEISIIWPREGGKLTMSIGRLKGMEVGKVSPRAFLRPTGGDLPSGVEQVIQVDEDCDQTEEDQGSRPGG
jgi:hypothetical protein